MTEATVPPESNTSDESSTERLSKHVAQLRDCSRQEAERYITGGWVTVDGVVIDSPQHRVSDSNLVAINNAVKLAPMEQVTILTHLSATEDALTITLANHATDDASDIHPLKQHFAHLTSALPLQPGASGLYILSQDARILRKLTEDVARVEQEYIVDVAGRETMPAHGMKQLNFALKIDGRTLPEAKVSWQNETKLRIAAKDLQQGQIAYMCEMVGLELIAMKRIRVGSISMGKLALGQWRYLPPGQKF
jgi:23S rRNA pseudouridine2604 synthase